MNKILLVDDEENILSGIRRQLKGKYELLTAQSGEEGVRVLEKEKKIQVIISDYKMPKMNGAQFLSKARGISPDSVRMMLTGQADMTAVIKIINEGYIYRFLLKPCNPDLLVQNINDGLEQYQLITAEKELLSKTLGGALQVIMDMLVLVKPQAFNRGVRIKELVKKMLNYMTIENSWQIEIAALLSQIGCITVPDSILSKIYKNLPLPPEDMIMYFLHTKTSSDVIIKIPRLEKTAEIIAYQEKYFNGTGFPRDEIKGALIPLGARMLRLCIDYDNLIQMNVGPYEALETIQKRQGWYDETLVDILEKTITNSTDRKKYSIKSVSLGDLEEGMFLADEIVTASGVIIGSNKQRITNTLKIILKNHLEKKEIREPISVMTIEE